MAICLILVITICIYLIVFGKITIYWGTTRVNKVVALLAFLSIALILLQNNPKQSTGVVLESPSGNVIKTVYHKHVKGDNYNLIAYDSDRDIAIYELVNSYGLDIGDTVITALGAQGTVTYIDADGFAFMPDDVSDIRAGMSGKGVRNTDYLQIGIVSGKWENGEVYCIWS